MTVALLLIEDDEDSSELLSLLLGSHGFVVTTAPSFDDAESLLELHAFDVILSDFFVGGSDAAASWRQLESVRQLAGPSRFGILTAYPIRETDAVARGFDFLLQKPCGANDLMGKLSDALHLPQVSARQETVVREYFAALERGTYDTLVSLCSPSVIYHLPRAPTPMPERVVGRTQFRQFAQATFDLFREPRFEVAAIRSLPSGALVRYSSSWLDEADARRELPGAVLFSFSDNEISEIGVRCDLSVIA